MQKLSTIILLCFVAHCILSKKIKQPPTVVHMYRLFHPTVKDHYLTSDHNKYVHLSANGWHGDEERFQCFMHPQAPFNVPLFQMYNHGAQDHLLTTSAAERDGLVHSGWVYEGVACYCGSSGGDAPLTRFYNPSESNHLSSTCERTELTKHGWIKEGVQCFVFLP